MLARREDVGLTGAVILSVRDCEIAQIVDTDCFEQGLAADDLVRALSVDVLANLPDLSAGRSPCGCGSSP